MTKQIHWTFIPLCLCTLLLVGCNKKTASLGEAVRVTLATTATQPGQPLPDTFATLQDHWSDENGVPWAAADSLAQLCKLSYASEAELNAAFSRWGFDKVNHFPSGSLYACVASNAHTVLVAFRGTDDPQDWLVNTDVNPQTVAHGIIHRGFYQAMKTLYPQVAAAATEHGAGNKSLWITGHSLGGAMAVAFAYESVATGVLRPAGLVTFGQPLVGDSALGAYLADQLGGNYVRFVNEHDIVTRVLPGYVHGGRLIWFHEGKLEMDAQRGLPGSASAARAELEPLSSAEFDSLRQSLRDLRQLGTSFDPSRLRSYSEQAVAITDHFMDAYLHGINALAQASRP